MYDCPTTKSENDATLVSYIPYTDFNIFMSCIMHVSYNIN